MSETIVEEHVDLALQDMHRSLDERWRPEDVAKRILTVLKLDDADRRLVEKVAGVGHDSMMNADFARPSDMTSQLVVAQSLFGKGVEFRPDDANEIERWLREADATIGKVYGQSDFKEDRIPAKARKQSGITISRRQYNKRFRLAARMEQKLATMRREQFKRALTLASKNRLASAISQDDFVADVDTACFIAYYVARCNLRSLFTNGSQARAYDQVCEALMRRCQNSTTTNWWAVAHVMPNDEVVANLDDEQKGVLLADYFSLMKDAAAFMGELAKSNELNADMTVRKGNDSTTWNVTAGAWNKLRDGWFSLMHSLGMLDAIERFCPGKALRLIAADVVAWHRSSGGLANPDTAVWNALPRPWQVMVGDALCPQIRVEQECSTYGVDPVKSGWIAPKPGRVVERFTPTPELVHGVAVASPALAALFRKAGVFSGDKVKVAGLTDVANDIRQRHWKRQEDRRLDGERMATEASSQPVSRDSDE